MTRSSSPTDSPWLALVVLCAGMLMIILDQTIVNVALPAMQRDLGFSQSSLAWVVNAYLIAFGGLLLLAGRLGDLIGRRRVFLAGLVTFTAASLLCGLSVNREMLIGARFVQGAGGALTSAVILGMIVTLFPEPREQAKAIGVYSFVAAAGGSIGLLAGGLLTEAVSWRWIFFVNLPVGVAATALAGRNLEPDRPLAVGRKADIPGAVLVTAALMLGVSTIVQSADYGRLSARTCGSAGFAALLFAGFTIRQITASAPLLPPAAFRSRTVNVANLVQALMVAGMFGFLFLGTLYLQRVLHYGPAATGAAFLPVALVIGALSLGLSARLNARFGARNVLLPGLALLISGLALFTRAPVDGRYLVDIFPVTLILGLGAGLALPALTTLAMSGATEEDSGLISGLFNTTQQVGGALGLAILASIATSRGDSLLERGTTPARALTGGYHLAFAVAAFFVGAALISTIALLRPAQADHPALSPSNPRAGIAEGDA